MGCLYGKKPNKIDDLEVPLFQDPPGILKHSPQLQCSFYCEGIRCSTGWTGNCWTDVGQGLTATRCPCCFTFRASGSLVSDYDWNVASAQR